MLLLPLLLLLLPSWPHALARPLGSPWQDPGASVCLLVLAVQLLSMEQCLPYAALKGGQSPTDWAKWE